MSKDKNYLLIKQDDVRKLVEIPVRGRIDAIGFTRYSELLGGTDQESYPLEPNGTYPVISNEVFNELYGKILTLVDAAFQEGSQKEAFKSIIKNEMSAWYKKSTDYTLKMTERLYNYKFPETSIPDYVIKKDGDKWYCTDGYFINLQESNVKFGNNPKDALDSFIKSMK